MVLAIEEDRDVYTNRHAPAPAVFAPSSSATSDAPPSVISSTPPSVPSSMAAAMASALAAGRAEWPEASLPEHLFCAHVARLGVDVEGLLRHGADLYITCACAAGDGAAVRAFERRLLPAVDQHLRAKGLARGQRDDVAQMVRIWLLAGARPRVGSYAGRGSLMGWLKLVAARRALRLRLRGGADPLCFDDDLAARLVAETASPELCATRSRFRAEFQRALDASLTALSPRARALLRMHYIEGLNIDAIGAVYGVHRATVARWLAGIRAMMTARLRELVSGAQRPTSSAFRSLAAAVRDELHISVDRVLPRGGACAPKGEPD
jgi:RNA polymerase sigma-70 factor (ECF subfamily)